MAVEGLTAFQRKMALIPKSVTDELRKELEKQATELVAMMRRLAPKDTGALANSIDWTWGAAPAGAIAIGTVAGSKDSVLRITVYAGGAVGTKRRQARSSGDRNSDKHRSGYFDSDVARFQEFGTKDMPANPFFFPSYRAKRRTIRSAMTRAIKRGLKNAV